MSMSGIGTRPQVLSLYHRILRLSKTWISKEPSETAADRKYIEAECKKLFRQNKMLEDPKTIRDAIYEAEARVEIALHYKNPYPRPVNVPPKSLAMKKGKEQGVAQERLKKQGRPIYIKSLDSN